MKLKALLIVFFLGVLTSCGDQMTKKVISQYADGSPKLVRYYLPGEDSSMNFKEELYYDNKKLQYKGKCEGGLRDGKWVSYYHNGNTWSIHNYIKGKEEGYCVVYHDNKKKRYEGEYKNGKESGVWKFYDRSGHLVREQDFGDQSKKAATGENSQ